MLQAYIETAEKILEEIQDESVVNEMAVDVGDESLNPVDFTKLGVRQYEEVRPTLRSNGENAAKRPMPIGTKIGRVVPVPVIELLRETTPESDSC